jgi:hypothetical protein
MGKQQGHRQKGVKHIGQQQLSTAAARGIRGPHWCSSSTLPLAGLLQQQVQVPSWLFSLSFVHGSPPTTQQWQHVRLLISRWLCLVRWWCCSGSSVLCGATNFPLACFQSKVWMCGDTQQWGVLCVVGAFIVWGACCYVSQLRYSFNHLSSVEAQLRLRLPQHVICSQS